MQQNFRLLLPFASFNFFLVLCSIAFLSFPRSSQLAFAFTFFPLLFIHTSMLTYTLCNVLFNYQKFLLENRQANFQAFSILQVSFAQFLSFAIISSSIFQVILQQSHTSHCCQFSNVLLPLNYLF